MRTERIGSLRRYRGSDGSSLLRLVCFPGAGSGASLFRHITHDLPDRIDVLAVQLPGREDRYGEPPIAQIEPIVEQLLSDLSIVSDRPFVFFGHSLGALLAYETAKSLRQCDGYELRQLIVSGHDSPTVQPREYKDRRCRSDAELIADIERLGGTPREVLNDRHMMKILLPILRADYAIADNYVHSDTGPLDCSIVACAGQDDPEINSRGLEAWRSHTRSSCQVHWFEGGHSYLQLHPQRLATQLRQWMDLLVDQEKRHIQGKKWS